MTDWTLANYLALADYVYTGRQELSQSEVLKRQCVTKSVQGYQSTHPDLVFGPDVFNTKSLSPAQEDFARWANDPRNLYGGCGAIDATGNIKPPLWDGVKPFALGVLGVGLAYTVFGGSK